MLRYDAERDFFSKGLASGDADFAQDMMYFRFRNERYELPASFKWRSDIGKHTHYGFVLPIDVVRKHGVRLNDC